MATVVNTNTIGTGLLSEDLALKVRKKVTKERFGDFLGEFDLLSETSYDGVCYAVFCKDGRKFHSVPTNRRYGIAETDVRHYDFFSTLLENIENARIRSMPRMDRVVQELYAKKEEAKRLEKKRMYPSEMFRIRRRLKIWKRS